MNKKDFLEKIDQTNLADEDKKIWHEAVQFLAPEIVQILAKEWDGQEAKLQEITAEIKAHKKTIVDLVSVGFNKVGI